MASKSIRSANWHLNEHARIKKLRQQPTAMPRSSSRSGRAILMQIKRRLLLQQRYKKQQSQHMQCALVVWARLRKFYLRGHLTAAGTKTKTAAAVKTGLDNPMQVIYARICENAVKKVAAAKHFIYEAANDMQG